MDMSRTTGRIYLNGSFVPAERASVRVDDRGFLFGDGVYEVVRVYEGRPFLLDEHLARLGRSLEGLEIPMPEPLERIAAACGELAAERPEGTIYLQVTRGAGPRQHAFPKETAPTWVAWSNPVGKPPESLRLRSVPDDRWGRCHLKTLNLLSNVLAKQAALRAGADEGLFVREDGSVTEGTSSNAFRVKGGTVETHPATNRILPGVNRDLVLRLLGRLGIPVREQAFDLIAAAASDEFFMTGTTLEVVPAVSLDGRPLGAGVPGPVTRALQQAFQDYRRST
jgi:D-alanine transaminase